MQDKKETDMQAHFAIYIVRRCKKCGRNVLEGKKCYCLHIM